MENIGYPTPDGTEGIVHVPIPIKTDGSSTDSLIGCIIDYKKLGIQCKSCYGLYKYMLILPVNSNNNNKYENTNIKDIKATFYNFEEKKQQTLKVVERVIVEPKELTHQFLACCMEDKEKRDKRIFKFPKSESEKAQSYVSKYSKTVGIDILKSREFCKEGNELFGISKSDNTSRAKFVALKFSKDEPGVLEKCSDLHPCGILLHGKKYFVRGNPKYDVEVIGSYSLVDGKITYKLILDEVNQTNTSADGSKASNGQNAAMNTDSVPSGSVLSDSSQLEDNQANNTNKPGVVATNELNITVVKAEGGPSGSSDHLGFPSMVKAENDPLALENDEGEEFLNEDKGEGGVVPNKNTGKNNVKPAAAADIGGNSSLAGGGENPSTGDSKEGREKLPKKNYPKQDEHDNRPDEGSPSDEFETSPTLDSSQAPDLKLDKLKELRKMWKDYHSQLPEHKAKAVLRRLLDGVNGLLEELGEERNRNFEKLQKNESENVRKFISWIEVLQDIVAEFKKSVELERDDKIEQLQKQLEDKEKIEGLREDKISLEKQLESAKKKISDVKVLINLKKNKFSHLFKESLDCLDEATQHELQEEMDYFDHLLDQRLDNIIDRSHVGFDDVSTSLR